MWDLIGNERVVDAVARSVGQNRVSHAYLFAGPTGVGKMTLAISLAQALNCTGGSSPCGECKSCLRIGDGKHADVLIVKLLRGEGEERKEISIEQVKELQQAAGLKPFEGKAKVFIVDGADQLTGEAANRLLKTLEEPPETVYIVLLAVDVGQVLPTMKSRCRVYELRPVPAPTIEAALRDIEGVESDRAILLARLADGCPGWAMAVVENEETLRSRNIVLAEVAEILFLSISERMSLAGRVADDFQRRRSEVARWLELLRQWWRDLLLVKAGRTNLVINVDRSELLEESAVQLSVEEIAEGLSLMGETGSHLASNVNSRLALEVLLIYLPVAERDEAVA